MGRLSGHLLPGFSFILFGLWWMYNILFRYYVSRKEAGLSGRGRKNMKYTSILLFPCETRCNRAPLEAFFIIAATTIGFIGELVTGFKGGEFANVGNSQHMSMYFFYGLMAFVNILMHYKFALPPGTDYVVAMLAVINEGLLFTNHLHGRPPMDVLVHTLLLYPILGTLVCGALEMVFRHQVLAAIGRAYSTLLQGTWFCHVGFILYPLPGMKVWDQENHTEMTVITTFFTVHMAVNFIIIMLMACLINFRVRVMSRDNVYKTLNNIDANNVLVMNNNNRNGEITRVTVSESEEEL